MDDFTTIKAHYGDDSRKLFIAPDMDYTHFLTAMRGMFPKGFNVIKYKDEDGEMVTMGSEEEYEVAIKKVSPLLGNKLNVYLEQNVGMQSRPDAASQKKDKKDDIKKGPALNPDIKRPPSLDNFEKEFLVEPPKASKAGFQKKSKQGKNSVKLFSELTASFFLQQKSAEKQKTEQTLADLKKDDDIIPPPDISYGYEMDFSLPDQSKIEGPDKLPLLEKENIKMPVEQRMKKKQKKKRRRSRRSSTSSSSSDSTISCNSDTYQQCYTQGQFYSFTNLSSSGSSSSSETSSESESSSDSDTGHDEFDKIIEDTSKGNQERNKNKKHQRKNNIRKIARKVTDYIAPDVCDEVEHCMHSLQKGMKKSLTSKITECIEEGIKSAFERHAGALNPNSNDAATIETKNEIGQRERYYHKDITCDGCDEDIYGPRYKCGNCADYDLCEACEVKEGIHDESHVFVKIIKPAPNAGRKNGKGKMRPLLIGNIYKTEEAERSSEKKPKSKRIEEALNSPFPVKAAEIIQAMPVKPEEPKEEPKPDDKPKVEETILEAEAAKEECSGNDLISPAKEKEECKLEKEDIQEYQDRDYENTEEDFERCESHSQSLDAEEDDVIVVRRGQFIEQKPSNQTPDLVDIDAESISSNGSEDFIVVPKVFDINTPLDENIVLQHRMTCTGGHNGPCYAHARTADALANIAMDLVASTIRPPGTQPSGEPDVTNLAMGTGIVIEKQPDINPSSVPDAVTMQPEFSTPLLPQTSAPAINTEETAVITKDQPTSDSTSQEPLPVTKQPAPKDVDQPEQLLIYGRGAVSKVGDKTFSEPDAVMMRDSALPILKQQTGDATPTDEVKVQKTEAKKTEPASVPKDPESNQANRPFQKRPIDNKDQEKVVVPRPPTWSPDSFHPVDEPVSTAELFPELIHGLVDATASAANAVYEGFASALNSGNGLPQVKYQNERVIIGQNDDSVEGIPRPLQTPINDEPQQRKQERPAMSANDMLCDMGFYDRTRNEKLLKKHKGDINQCVTELLTDNNWHSNRH